MNKKILNVTELTKSFTSSEDGSEIHAVDNISLYVEEKETLGLVGESGCGKTTTGKMILKLVEPDQGDIQFYDNSITGLSQKQFRPLRKKIQMIFQDLDAALNPNMRILDILSEAIKLRHPKYQKNKVKSKALELLERVHLPAGKLEHFPNSLSGGEKRRVGIARTLAMEPEFIVADEPTSALDVSVQAQVINLMQDLQKDYGLSYLFISHDLHLVELLSHRIAVMYLGKIVELGPAKQIAQSPRHPYTQSLWASLAINDKENSTGSVDAFTAEIQHPAHGCRFAPRCVVFQSNGGSEKCHQEPQLSGNEGDHQVACHFPLT